MVRAVLLSLAGWLWLMTPAVGAGRLTRLLQQTRTASYYDSASVFTQGGRCITLARSMHNLAAEAEVYIYYGNFNFYSEHLDKAKDYYEKAFKTAVKAGSEHIETLALIRLAYVDDALDKPEAKKRFETLLREAKDRRDKGNQVECLNAISLLLRDDGLDNIATDTLYSALRIAEKCENKMYLGMVLNNLGLVKMDNGHTAEAKKDFERGLRAAEAAGDFRLAVYLSTNLAVIYSREGETEKAHFMDKKQIEYARKTGFKPETVVAYINFASTLMRMDSLKQAIVLLDSAAMICLAGDTMPEISKAYLGKAQVLIRMKKNSEALYWITQAQEIAQREKSGEDVVMACEMRAQIFKDRGDYRQAMLYMEMGDRVGDSLRKLHNSEAIAEITLRFENEKKRLAIQRTMQRAKLEEQTNRLRTIRMSSIIAISLVLVITLAIVIYIRWIRITRKQQERFAQQLLDSIDKERGRIARDLHDDLGQSLSAIKSRISAVNIPLKREEIDEELGRVIEQTREISRKLYPAYLEKVGLKVSMLRLAEATQTLTGMECSCETDEKVEELSSEQKTHLFRIIQECVNNTVKHAKATALKMTLVHDGTRFILQYMDNGKAGAPLLEAAIKTGMGLMSIRERARMLGGEAIMHQVEGRGFKLIVTFR